MSCLGVLLSLDKSAVDKLKSISSDEDRLDFVQMEIEEEYFTKYRDKTCELENAWDAIHRVLTDGTLNLNNGVYPLNHFILGGEIMHTRPNHIMILKSPQQVNDIFEKFDSVTIDAFKTRYFQIDKASYGLETSADDFDYTWTWFIQSRNFWKLASEEKRYVLFTADQ